MDETKKKILKPGLTWRVLLALIVSAVLFIPASLYLNLVTGATVSTAAIYIITILISELSGYYGAPLTTQEVFILYATIGSAVGGIPAYYWLIYRAFFVTSPVSYAYKLNGIPLPLLVPSWLSPPPSYASHVRTLIDPHWTLPIAVATLSSFLGWVADVGLGIFIAYLMVNIEKLPFPFANIDASLVETISIKKPENTKFFMAGFYPGLIYGFFVYFNMSLRIPLIPFPWFDLTWLTQKWLPGALIGIATDPSPFVFGLLLPLNQSFSLFLGSVIVWILLNFIFTVNPSFFPSWYNEYYRGMQINAIYLRSTQRIWISPLFGISLGTGLAIFLMASKGTFGTIKSLFSKTSRFKEATDYPLWLGLLMFLFGSLGSVILFMFLIPDFPIYLPVLASLFISPLIGLLAARSVGQLGFAPTIPWPWQALVYFTNYQGYAGWVYSPYICMGGPGGLSQAVKVSYMTETRPKDYFIAIAIAYALNMIVGFIALDIFWRIAPIPSSAYPNTMIYWPVNAANDGLFATRQIILSLPTIVACTALSFVLVLVTGTSAFSKFFNPIAFVTGVWTLPPYSIMILLGSLANVFLFSKYLGKAQWESKRGVLIAGFFSGVGIFLSLGIALTLLMKAAWIWPW